MGTLLFVIALFLSNNLLSYGVVTFAMITVIVLSKIPFMKFIKGIKPILAIMFISTVCNLLFTKGGEVLIEAGIVCITTEGVIKAMYITVRLVFVVLGTSIMTLTTKPSDIADGLEKALGFLTAVKFPVHEMAMMVSLALRFIPTLMEEEEKIVKAKKARGANFESGNFLTRVKNYLPILVPLFVSAINRALELATAMEARCYHGGIRTKMKPLKYEKKDVVSYVIQFVFIITVVMINIYTVNSSDLSYLVFI